MKEGNRIVRKIVSIMTVVTMIFSMVTMVSADTDYTRYTRLSQPRYSHTFETNELGVVNFHPKWGDKEANVASMKEYVEEAHEKGTKILLFPEMCVTGYASSSNPKSETYQMPIENAEPLNGPTQQTFSELSDEYDMWIIYGGTQTVYNEDGTIDEEHAYNSAFACLPEGEVTAYQKITPVEGAWCTPGDTPVLIDAGEYGMLGISICYDTYATPELGRYYAAKGCSILLNPTATSRSYSVDNDKGWEWYYKNRLESGASREGYTIMSADLVGTDGATVNGKQSYLFPGGSVIMKGSPVYYAGVVDSQLGKATTSADIVTGEEGLITNCAKVSCSTGSTCRNEDFNPEMYAQLYKRLADKKKSGSSLSYTSTVEDGPVAAVVNMPGIWGDKQANVDAMTAYVEEAAEKNVDILVFPETVLTGYQYIKPDDGNDAMQVKLAETIPGKTTNYFSELAQKYNMYIIFGMSEKDKNGPIYENGVEKVYNSAAICMPDGTIDSYQKIHRAGSENQWSVPGKNPKMFETEWGKIGIDICRDGHFYPELGRYYAAMGCTILIHPTATTGNPWYRETRIGSYTDRDGMAAITCNLLGGDGIYNEETEKWSGGVFASTSLIITKYNGSGRYNADTGYAIDLNGTGSESEGYAERGTSPEGLEVAKMNLKGCGFKITNFNPDLFSRMYDELATLYREGYKTIYPGESISKPVTIDLTPEEETTEETTLEEITTEVPEATTIEEITTKSNTVPAKNSTIKVKKVKVKSTKRTGKTKAKISLKAVSGVKGYVVKYSTKKKFGKKTTIIKKVKKATFTIKKLKANKNYYVKVRAYKVVNNKTYYGKWSNRKTVKVYKK